ncbi:MAG: sigma 54-interacting transcriptional regulator, partial [Pseudomonadota bacterium]
QSAARLAKAQVPILLAGETGTGKETLARAIHVAGGTKLAFHSVRCAGLSLPSLQALTEASGGTLFLRGIEDLDGKAQDALLNLLDIRDDLRVISSTRQAERVSTTLRDDLHFRVMGAVLDMPPLRARLDLEWLADRLLRRRSAGEAQLSPTARAEIAGRPWPGNIRELQSVLDIALSLSGGQVIDLSDLPPRLAPQSEPREDLEAVLHACAWNMAQAARRLGVNRSTILRRVRKAGLTPPS